MSPLKTKGFSPYLAVVFLNAFVDLGHKIIIQNTVFKIEDGKTQIILIAIVNAMILLPFVALFTPAGFLSDKFKKTKIIRISAFFASILTLLITFFYYQGMYIAAFIMTLLLATQSAFYSPAKFGLIKQMLGDEHLTAGNAYVQATTIIAILGGIFIFSILFENFLAGFAFKTEADILQKIAPVGWILFFCSLLELAMAYRIPMLKAGSPDKRFIFSKYVRLKYLNNNLQTISRNKIILGSILGLAGFWSISQVTLAAFPAFAKQNLQVDDTVVVQGILACAGIGIFIGSSLLSQYHKDRIETGLIPLGSLMMTVSLLIIPYLETIMSQAVAFILLGMFGSFFIVPLNALIQHYASDEELGTVLAANNWVGNVFMLSFLGLAIFFAYHDFSSKILLLLMAMVSSFILIVALKKLFRNFVYFLGGRLFTLRYRLSGIGTENIPATGAALLLGNHISYIDWAMLQVVCPRPIHFVIERKYYDFPVVKQFLNFFGVIPISSGQSKQALLEVTAKLKQGEAVCLFPEGGISNNGQLGEFKRGFERSVVGVQEGVIVPFYIQGLWGSRFSKSNKFFQKFSRQGLRRKVYIGFGKPIDIINANAEVVKQKVFETSVFAWDATANDFDSLIAAWLRQVKRHSGKLCMVDAIGGKVNWARAFTASVLFSRLLAKYSRGQNIGAILPTSSAGIITNMASLMAGKTIVNLNFTSSLQALKSAVQSAQITEIYTSSRFIEKLKGKGVDLTALLDKTRVYYLEELKGGISIFKKLVTLASIKFLPKFLINCLYIKKVKNKDPACIMFSSGSEGAPKGVVLTHKNVHVNARQILQIFHTRSNDVVMNTLPLFHSFGFTVTSLMPLIGGIPLVSHPDPTDVVNIGKSIAKYKATLYCGTSTFLRMFVKNRRVAPQMLESLRYIIAGAEKLQPEIRQEFQAKFNKEILEGYGATETAPVSSVNVPDFLDINDWQIRQGHKLGSVGLPLPGTCVRIVDPRTYAELLPGEDGLILIAGPQLMREYLNESEKTSNAFVELDEIRWYKTGDKGHMDKNGFITIVDRYSRFANIGGEMVSLGAVEAAICKVLKQAMTDVATVNVPDSKKGEQIVLLFVGDTDPDEIMDAIRSGGINPLMRPGAIFKVDEIPRLGSGKCDFSGLKKLALELLGEQRRT